MDYQFLLIMENTHLFKNINSNSLMEAFHKLYDSLSDYDIEFVDNIVTIEDGKFKSLLAEVSAAYSKRQKLIEQQELEQEQNNKNYFNSLCD